MPARPGNYCGHFAPPFRVPDSTAGISGLSVTAHVHRPSGLPSGNRSFSIVISISGDHAAFGSREGQANNAIGDLFGGAGIGEVRQRWIRADGGSVEVGKRQNGDIQPAGDVRQRFRDGGMAFVLTLTVAVRPEPIAGIHDDQ